MDISSACRTNRHDRHAANGITVPARRASEGIHLHHFATEEPLLARRAGTERQSAVFARMGIRPFSNFERSEQARPAAPTATIAMRQMGSQYQPDAPARESTSIISPPKNPCWRDGLVLNGNPRFSRGVDGEVGLALPGSNVWKKGVRAVLDVGG